MNHPTPLLRELPLGYYLTPERHVLARAPLGFTAYLDGHASWARGGAQRVLRRFVERVGSKHLRFLSTSLMPEWVGVEPSLLDETLASFEQRGVLDGLRHNFWMMLTNDPGAPGLGFKYFEYDPRRADRSGILEVTLYEVHDPTLLLELALAVLEAGPVFSLIGGFTFRWDAHDKALAFQQIYRWASRHVAIDIQMAEDMSWVAPRAVPGASWLTYVGGTLARNAEIDLDALRAIPFSHDVRRQDVADGLLLRAGEAPMQGDLNRFRWPYEVAEVARALAPWFPEPFPELWGPFYAWRQSELWYRRLLDPSAWVERDPATPE